jgi:hypothetical protein
MKTVKSVQEAIGAVNNGAVAVYRDTYKDQILPSYRVLETEEEAVQFQRLVQQVEKAESGTLQVSAAIEKLEEFVGDRWCLPSHLEPIYKDGRWLWDPESLLRNEESSQAWLEDQSWFDAQREHFAEMEDPTPIVADEPWLDKVVELATKIAAKEGRAPEEADFNAATLQLRNEIPQEQVGILQNDLRAIEEGRSTAYPHG